MQDFFNLFVLFYNLFMIIKGLNLNVFPNLRIERRMGISNVALLCIEYIKIVEGRFKPNLYLQDISYLSKD
jgi:hypothetical protein